MCHPAYKREKYTFINANIQVTWDNRQTLKCKYYLLTFLGDCLQFNSILGQP